ncbi:MAG: hypothetical protein KDB27_23375 [Planctomycetales bacterium]|nr:hypothetical protein [Planctomycetales bacterium]
MTEERKLPKRENVWLNICLNVIVPSILMSQGAKIYKFATKQELEANYWVLIVALAFPVAYGIYDFITRKKYNFFSVLGFVSILITGMVGIFELDGDWIAVKEAAVPALFAIAVLVSLKTPFPLVRTFLFNPEIFDVPKIEAALREKGNRFEFEKLLAKCTLYLVGSFALSAVLNYGLAKYTIHSDPGTEQFNVELGKMTALSWPVITIPSVAVMMIALFKLVKGVQQYTGYEIDDVLLIDAGPKKDDAESKSEAEAETNAEANSAE